MSTLKLNNLEAATGTTINIASGDKISGASGAIAVPGSVVQTVNATHNTEITTASTSFVATALNALITPKFSTSKILVSFSLPVYSASGTHVVGTVFRETGTAASGDAISGTNLGSSSWGFSSVYDPSAGNMGGVHCSGIFDSPSTTSQLRYTVACLSHNGGTVYAFINGAMATLVVQEIAQ